MAYTPPVLSFAALEHARNKVLRANQFQELVVQQYKNTYEDFWGLFPDGDSRYTVDEMQSILDVLGATAIDMLTDAGAFVQYLATAYPGAVDEKYFDAAFDYTVGESGITVTALKDVWKKPEEEENAPGN